MDYQKQATVLVLIILAVVQAQNLAEDSFISRYNENKNYQDSNYFPYNVIDEEIPSFIDIRPRESFHDIYTFKRPDGESQRLHYAVDDNGPRANFQSNVVQFGQNTDLSENSFGARLRPQPIIRPDIPQEYSGRKSKDNEIIPNMQTLNVGVEKFGQPAVFPDSFVPLNTLQYPVPNKVLNENENAPALQNTISPSYQSSPIIIEPIAPFFSEGQSYDSQRISKPNKKSTYPLLSKSFGNISPPLTDRGSSTTSEYIPLLDNVPKSKISEHLTPFENISLVVNGFDTLNYEMPMHYNQSNTSASELPSYSRTKSTALEDKPRATQFLSVGKENQALQAAPQETLDKEHNFLTENNSEIFLNGKMIRDSLVKNHTSNSLQKQRAASIKSYFRTKSQLASSQLPKISNSTTLLSSPMSTVFDTSNENGGYYHYVMNLGQNRKKNWEEKTKIYSTGSALYKLLNETGIQFQSTLKKKPTNKILTSALKNKAKILRILAGKAKKINGKKSTNKPISDLEVAGDMLDVLNTSIKNIPNNSSNLISVNNQVLNTSEETLQKSHIESSNETSTPTAKFSPQTTEVESSTTPSATMESYTVSSFLEDLFDIHEAISDPEFNSYQEASTTSTQSTSDFYFGETPLYITEVETPLELNFVPTNSTEKETLNTTKAPYELSTFSSGISTETTTVNGTTDDLTTVKFNASSTPSEEASTTIPITIPSVLEVTSDFINHTTIADMKSRSVKDNNLSTVTIQETTTGIPTEAATKLPVTISPMKLMENDLESSISNRVENETVIVKIAPSTNLSLSNEEEKSVESVNPKKVQPKLELVIQSTEMNDFMHRINNMPIFIRVLNPKQGTELRSNQTKSAVIDDKIKNSSVDSLNLPLSNETTLTLNHLPATGNASVEKHSNKLIANSSTAESVFHKLLITPTIKGADLSTEFLTGENGSNSINSETEASRHQVNGTEALPFIHDLIDAQFEDNSFTPLGEESKANVEVASSDESLQLIPIFFENEHGTSDLNGDFVEFQIIGDILENYGKGSIMDDLVEVNYSNNHAQKSSQNAAIDSPEVPLSIDYVVNTPQRDFMIDGQIPNFISLGYGTNDVFAHRFDSGNVTGDSLDDSMNSNGYEDSPYIEYDLIQFPDINSNGHQTLDTVELFKNDEHSNNATDALFQNVRETKNVYDLSPLREYIDIIPYSDIGNNEQSSVPVQQNGLNADSTNRLFSGNLTQAPPLNAVNSHNYYEFSPHVEYGDLIEYKEINHNGGGSDLIPEYPIFDNIAEGFMVNNQNFIENNERVDFIDPLEYKNFRTNEEIPILTLENQHSNDITKIFKTSNRSDTSLPTDSGIQELPSNDNYIDFIHYSDPSEKTIHNDKGYYLSPNDPVDDFSIDFEAKNRNDDNFFERGESQKFSKDGKYIDFMHYNNPSNNDEESVVESQSPDSLLTIKNYGDLPSNNDKGQYFLLDDSVDFKAAAQSPTVFLEAGQMNDQKSPALLSSSQKYGTRILHDRSFENIQKTPFSDAVGNNEFQLISSLNKIPSLSLRS